MSSLQHARLRVHPTSPSLRLVEPPPPCPSERTYEAACYLVWFRQRNRWCPRCLAECNGSDVPAWLTAARPEPGEAELSMPDWIEAQAAKLHALGSDLAEWLAAKVDELAAECRTLDATTPAEFEDRREALTEWVAEHDRMSDADVYPAGCVS
jgi:hypothetical protein